MFYQVKIEAFIPLKGLTLLCPSEEHTSGEVTIIYVN